jgi:uncharacterized Tic20 family protein
MISVTENVAKNRAEWNYLAVLSALGGAIVLQSILGPTLCYLGTVNMYISLTVDSIVVLRLIAARMRRERGGGWVFYSILPYLVLPVFLVTNHVWVSS